MAALMVSLFVAAMDSTVVGTALPTIARELGSFELYPWVVAGYLITGTTTVPLWGRLADIRGRKPVLLAGLAIFVVASALCAWSPSMLWLIAFRTLQGIGAECIQPLVFTTVGDIFPLEQRARLQGFFSSMWAIAAIAGRVRCARVAIQKPNGAAVLVEASRHRPGDLDRAHCRHADVRRHGISAAVGAIGPG